MKKKNNKQLQPSEQKPVSFRRLVFEALPEMWGFQFLITVILGAFGMIMWRLITLVAESSGAAVTTANARSFLLSWRSPVLLLLGIVFVLFYTVTELFAQIHMTDDVLNGHPTGIRRELMSGIRSLKRFKSPTGVLILLFIIIAVPLCGIGFSVSLTRSIRIPNFVMDVMISKPYYILPYLALLLVFILIAYRYCFTLHAVLLDGMSCREGRKASARIIKAHGKRFLFTLIKTVALLAVIEAVAQLLFSYLPGLLIEHIGQGLPHDRVLDLNELSKSDLSDQDAAILGYRILSAFTVILGGYLNTIVTLLSGAYFMLRFTRCYREYSSETVSDTYPERPKKARYRYKLIFMFLITLLVAVLSLMIGVLYDHIIKRDEPVQVIAHRTGGTLASENSVEGLYAAIEHSCYGSETDIQRTKDGYYVINHDNDFKRLTGVARAPKDMTFDEVKELRIKDTTGSGAELTVPTLDEMLDVVKDKEKLFIELKGVTADRQMVDDVVRMVREKDCTDDVVLISLDYDVIDYAETAYPEFETGVLIFAGLGNVARLNCDLLIMEEDMGTETRIDQIHNAGKKAIVWTVNTESSMLRFLDSDCDAIITDEIALAEQVSEKLASRTEYQVLQDKLADFWSFN